MMLSNSKLKKPKISSPVDIISDLPDSILSQILSFLPTTKEAVATSVLSKRWKYVWTYVDMIKFDTSGLKPKARKQVPSSVYKVLNLHQGNIKGFTLSGHNIKYEELDVMSWINTAISRGVERLHVDIDLYGATFKWPWPRSILTCKTLVDLRLWDLRKTSVDIPPPSTTIFPCLKKLKVPFSDPGLLSNLVSRCSALEHLIVASIVASTTSPIHIVSSSIKRLDLDIGHPIALDIPSLEYLELFWELRFEVIAGEQLSSVIGADIFFWDDFPDSRKVRAKELRDSFVRFIKPFSNVKLLRIQFSHNTFFNSIGNIPFVNLTTLEIVSKFFEWRLLLCFMESSINLENITLVKMSKFKKHKLEWKEPTKVPTSLYSSVKKVSIYGYSEDELPMVTYVLRTAQTLEELNIHCAIYYKDNNDWKYDMLQNLRKLHRACERCEISLT